MCLCFKVGFVCLFVFYSVCACFGFFVGHHFVEPLLPFQTLVVGFKTTIRLVLRLNQQKLFFSDRYDFTGDLDISFWMLPDHEFHDGPIFNVGTEDNFKYYEYFKQNHTQFLVIEITYEAVSVFIFGYFFFTADNMSESSLQ